MDGSLACIGKCRKMCKVLSDFWSRKKNTWEPLVLPLRKYYCGS